MNKTCQKCGLQNLAATGEELEACPACNAIYSRVEAAIAEGRFTPIAQQKPKPAKQRKRLEQPFIETLRAGSHYPNFRTIVGFFALAGYAFAALIAVVAVMAGPIMMAKAGGIVFAAFIVIVSKVSKEAALMLADLSDAAVVIAEDSYNKSNEQTD